MVITKNITKSHFNFVISGRFIKSLFAGTERIKKISSKGIKIEFHII